jgi:hypothetical protein
MRFSGRWYQEVRSIMQREVIASEIEGRFTKAVLRETLQYSIVEEPV